MTVHQIQTILCVLANATAERNTLREPDLQRAWLDSIEDATHALRLHLEQAGLWKSGLLDKIGWTVSGDQ